MNKASGMWRLSNNICDYIVPWVAVGSPHGYAAALEWIARKIGTVTVDMGGTCCQVPDAVEYIAKIEARGSLGKKKKTVKC